MNEIELLKEKISLAFPSVKIILEKGEYTDSNWFLDLVYKQYHIVVEWIPENKIFRVEDEGNRLPGKRTRNSEDAFQQVSTLLDSL